MEYLYCNKENFEDFASGRVIYSSAGIPNFPVRLINEIFRRGLSYLKEQENLTVYDPCCGGGYLLTVLGFCNPSAVQRFIGSDIDTAMIPYAEKNLGLLTRKGLEQRMKELEEYIAAYQKQSHMDAKASAVRMGALLRPDISFQVFQADCTQPLPIREPIDMILTDIPYGNLVSWQGEAQDPLSLMLKQLADIASDHTILALSMDKKQKFTANQWTKLESQQIGKRKFVIFRKKA